MRNGPFRPNITYRSESLLCSKDTYRRRFPSPMQGEGAVRRVKENTKPKGLFLQSYFSILLFKPIPNTNIISIRNGHG